MEFRSMFDRKCTEDAARELGLSVEDYIAQQKYWENENARDTTKVGGWYEAEDIDGEWSVWLKVSADKDTLLPDGKDKLVSARGISQADALLMVDAKAAQIEGGE
tara:strand:- start:1294 stop:1608 length:315 start_codon:yes stop_codon:yes gene_type:complete